MIYFEFCGILEENHKEGIYGVSKEMLSKFFQTHVFVLAITWSFLILIE